MGNVDEFLEHVGVKGMKWGVRKSSPADSVVSSAKPKKPLTAQQKKARKDLIIGTTLVASSVAIRAGAAWAAQNPDKLETFVARAANKRFNIKSVGPGYEIAKLTLSSNGVWK